MRSRENLSANFYLHIRDGRSQESRLLPPLRKDYFNVAEMSFQTLLAKAVDYARLMRFYNLRDKPEGTWESFFTGDETAIIAAMLTVDVDQLMANAAYQVYKTNTNKVLTQALCREVSAKEIGQPLMATYAAISLLDNWLQLLLRSQSQISTELRNVVRSVIIGLEKDIDIFCHYLAVHLPSYQSRDFFSDDFIALLSQNDSAKPSDTANSLPDALDPLQIRASHYALLRAIEMVQASAAKLLSASLVSGDHDPAAGLLLAFLQLFQKLQNKINRFTLNYVDFYYDRVLKAQIRDWVPDRAYLVILPNKKDCSILIPENTEFFAGKDKNKQDIVYASVGDVAIHDAVVSVIHTLFFKRDILNFPENRLEETVQLDGQQEPLKRQFTTGCWISDVPVRPNADDRQGAEAYPLFGAPREEESLLVQHGRIGFAFASKTLFLHEGERTIKVTVKFTDARNATGRPTLEDWIRKIAVAMHSNAAEGVRAVTQIQEQQAFFKIFKDIFTVSLSTENGWMEIGEYLPSYRGVDKHQSSNSFSITFLLPENFPAVTAYRHEIHGDGYETELPMVRFILNPRNYLYAYGLLRELDLAWVDIEVGVKGCRTLQLHNNIGQLSLSAPFMPFGPLPEVGSYLIVGCPETAHKQLTDCDVEIEWGGLPGGLGGFKTHYQAYEGFGNPDFLISTSVLSNGKWLPKKMKSSTISSLFQTKFSLDGGSMTEDFSVLPCHAVIPNWSAADCRKLDTVPGYSPATRAGFFKFTLISPQQAFGHRDYPIILAETLTFNARQKDAKHYKKLPNPPYTPVINSISVNYRASSRLIPGNEDATCASTLQEKMVYLHPFGWEDTAVEMERVRYSLLPHYSCSGNLFIGLSGLVKGKVITLYFHLRDNSLPVEPATFSMLRWHYLSNNRWIPLKANAVLSDSTHRFMKSGIVTLDIPADISQDNTQLPQGYFWLQLSAECEVEKFCSLYSIYAQAIEVRRLSKNVPANVLGIPAGTIVRAQKSIPGIGGIRQIQQSFGGVLGERRDHLRVRISERLKHKNRALLPVDYELLILEQFPQLFKVKCFSGMNPKFMVERRFAPGHLLIVAIPYLAQDEIATKKLFLNGELISEIEDFIRKHAPYFATIHVMNPVYEVIQVRCTVKLKNAAFSGMYLNRLNQAISDFLSPWNETVGYTRHFGWNISKHDIESFIRNLDYIDRVTNLSLLRIAPLEKDLFDLYDSAANYYREDSGFRDIVPMYPWSIVAPIQRHFIEVDDRFDVIEPKITGIGELEIGSTFIVSDEKWREKIEKH